MSGGVLAVIIFGSALGLFGPKGCQKEIEDQEAKALNKPTFTVGDCMCQTSQIFKDKCYNFVHKIIDINLEGTKVIIVQGNLPKFDYWYGESVESVKTIQNYYTPVECPKESK